VSWQGRKVIVTGGASFIGSHLVDALVAQGASVRVVDNLSSGKLENIQEHLNNRCIEFIRGDLLDPIIAREAVQGMEVVFHLAADHGGRGYVDLHQAACSTNLTLDGNVFMASSTDGPFPGDLSLRGDGGATPRRRQHVWLGQADGRDDPQELLLREGAERDFLPLLHRLW